MNMQTKLPLSVAEQKIVDQFVDHVGVLPGCGVVTSLRDRLICEIKDNGLPTRRLESWHYTNLKTLLRDIPDVRPADNVSVAPALLSGSDVLLVANGHTARMRDIDGVTLLPFRDCLTDPDTADDLIPNGPDDAIGQINGAFVFDGISMAIDDDAVLDAPIEIQLAQAGGQAHTRLPVQFGARSRATIVERHMARAGPEALTTTVSTIDVGESAEITWVIVQQCGEDDTHLGQTNIRLGADAKLTIFILNAGGQLVRQELHVETTGEGADLTFRAINLLGGDSHNDITLTLGHNVAHTTSTETVRNVLFDRAAGVFQGQIRVAPDAQKTDARMACNTLLLSDDADFSCKPELEIFADDVQCAHGATVTDIEPAHLFYLMARGIPEKAARALLVQAFVEEIVEELPDEDLVDALKTLIETWLEGHG